MYNNVFFSGAPPIVLCRRYGQSGTDACLAEREALMVQQLYPLHDLVSSAIRRSACYLVLGYLLKPRAWGEKDDDPCGPVNSVDHLEGYSRYPRAVCNARN